VADKQILLQVQVEQVHILRLAEQVLVSVVQQVLRLYPILVLAAAEVVIQLLVMLAAAVEQGVLLI
jgi:hypothetical protein